jgi:hypothetical protein
VNVLRAIEEPMHLHYPNHNIEYTNCEDNLAVVISSSRAAAEGEIEAVDLVSVSSSFAIVGISLLSNV